MKVPLEKMKTGIVKPVGTWVDWSSAKPYVDNERGTFIHRLRSAGTYKLGDKWRAHHVLHYLCGASTVGRCHFTLHDTVPEGRLMCVKCSEKERGKR